MPALRTAPPPPSALSRAWFRWVQFWSAFLTVTMSPGLVLHSQFRPSPGTFRAWMRPWARAVLAMGGVRVVVEERAPQPDGPVVYVANHVNALDIPVAMAALPRPCLFVARHEIREWPIVGWVLDQTPCLFIQRDDPRQAIRDVRRIAEVVRDGDSVLLYPEGGRSHGHAMLPFMRGPFVIAIEAGVPVVPVTTVGHEGVFSSTVGRARRGETRFVLGAPIPTAGLRRADAAELQDRVRTVIEGELAAYG